MEEKKYPVSGQTIEDKEQRVNPQAAAPAEQPAGNADVDDDAATAEEMEAFIRDRREKEKRSKIKDDDADETDEEEEKEESAKDDAAEESAEESTEEAKEEPEKEEKKPVKKAAAVAGAKKKPEIDMEIDGKDDDEDDEKAAKKSNKKKIHIPNFKKFRWPLLIGVVIIAGLVALGYWMSNIAPAAKITVKVKTTAANFNETVTFVTDQTKSDPEKGIFFAEQKTVTKQASDDFEATGTVDKGTKATGSITVKVKSPITIASGAKEASFTVPAGTIFTHTAGN